MHSKSPKSGLLSLVRDNLTNITAFTTIIMFFFIPILGIILGLTLVYFIVSQFIDLPLYKLLRRVGYHCYYLQFASSVIHNDDITDILFNHRDMYIEDYIHMGYGEFNEYATEFIKLDTKWNRILNGEELIENCFN